MDRLVQMWVSWYFWERLVSHWQVASSCPTALFKSESPLKRRKSLGSLHLNLIFSPLLTETTLATLSWAGSVRIASSWASISAWVGMAHWVSSVHSPWAVSGAV